jgi:hypothetical protein
MGEGGSRHAVEVVEATGGFISRCEQYSEQFQSKRLWSI